MPRRGAVLGLLAAVPSVRGQFDPLPTRQSTVVPDLSLCAYVRLNEGAPFLSLCCRQRAGATVSPSVCLTDCILDFEESDTTLKWWTCPLAGGAKFTTVDYAWTSPTTAPTPVASPLSTKLVPSTSTSAAATTSPQTPRPSPSPSPPPPSTSLSKPTIGTTNSAPSSTTSLVETSTSPAVTTLPSPSSTAEASDDTVESQPGPTTTAIESSRTDSPTATPTATDGQVKDGGSETAATQSSKTAPRQEGGSVVAIAVVMAIMMALE